MAEAFFEVEGGEACAEDRVFAVLPNGGMVKLEIPDDVEGEDDAQDGAQGGQ